MRRFPACPPITALLLLAFVYMGGLGCSKDSTSPASGGDCDTKIATARQALENVLYQEINSDPERPSDINFQAAYQRYQEALQCSGSSSEANFGASVLGILSLTSDAQVNAAFDQWKTYLETHTPFEAPATRLRPLGVPIALAGGPQALHLPFDLATFSVLALARPQRNAADPQIAQMQTILETRVLPRLTEALARLAVVAADPNYRFIVTPRMQGDTDADPVEIDHTDVLALRSACGLLASACHVAVSYDLNFASYDSLGLMQALTPGSGWMARRSQGASHMGSAGTTLSGAIDDLDAAITSLLAENDPQDDDVIKIGPDGVSRADAESVQVHLDDVRAGLANGYVRSDDWDGNPGTPDVPLTIRLGQLFTNPVPDWKELFPDYTPSVVRKGTGSYYAYQEGAFDTTATAPADGNYSGQYILGVQDRQVSFESYFGDAFLEATMMKVVQDRYAIALTTANWTGYFSAVAQFGGPLSSGLNSISVFYQTYTEIITSRVYSPIITWSADSFDQWIWPDPTLHGVLPGMGSSTQLLSTFGITAQDWSKQVDLAVASNGPPLARRRPLP